ncbi:PREDICTED: uncharacterized protein LOC104773642 [Camelina sativa]|uniref:Uncharacterized protein LOC104773642 n=1 Tax=Camelina sativa TaxID=90675 RepID=A0ABM0Y757_CAMSA|nr:PREDICTED: uncharacterized protein LOC104773642 [Camelina sativa]
MVHFNRVKDLHSWRSHWKVCVKVLRKLRKIDENDNTVELILCDVFGDKIQGTIKKDLIVTFYDKINENTWIILSNFTVCYNDLRFKLADNETVIDNSEEVISNNHFIDYQSFDEILQGRHVFRNLTCDVMGQVVHVERLIHVVDPDAEIPYKRTRLLRFYLRNLNGLEIDCVAYNKHADYFDANWSLAGGNDATIVVLRFWRAKYTLGGPSDSGAFSGPVVSVDLWFLQFILIFH